MRPITVDNLGLKRLRDSSSGSDIFLMVKASPGGIQNVWNLAVGELFKHLNTNQRTKSAEGENEQQPVCLHKE